MDSPQQLIDRVAATTVHRDRDEIERELVQLLLQFLQADSVALLRVAREGGTPRVNHCITAHRLGGGEAAITRDPGEAAALALNEAWRRCVATREIQTYRPTYRGAATVFPVLNDGDEQVGLLEVRCAQGLAAREVQLVQGILRIIRNHLALLEYGERDTLTGLLNRRTFEVQFEKLRHELHPATPAGSAAPSWMGLVDIDRFKSINDQYGHLFGDEVLLIVGQVLQRTFRSSDRVYRFGGEEFVILLHRVPEHAAAAVLERLRAAVEQHVFPQVSAVTISIGWTQIQPQDGPTTCMQRADAALYSAKDSGRNRVCRYESLLAHGGLISASRTADVELF